MTGKATSGQARTALESRQLRVITGALKSCIDAHGPIHPGQSVGSAAKRVRNQLAAAGLLAPQPSHTEGACSGCGGSGWRHHGTKPCLLCNASMRIPLDPMEGS